MSWTQTGTFPRGPHRMADPSVRVRTLLAIAALIAGSWGGLAAFARSSCDAYSERELRELAALPAPPACVEGRLPPANPATGVSP